MPWNGRLNRNGLRNVALAALLTTLGGCISTPAPDLKPPVPDTWRHVAPAGTPTTDLQNWWKALGDPQLDALIERAMQSNLDVQQAAERLRSARILYPHAKDAYLPNLHARTNDVIDPDTTASYFVVGFDAMWELPLFGSWQGTDRLAQSQVNSAAAALRGAQVSLVAEITRRWIELRSAQAQGQLLQSIYDAQAQRAKLVQTRVDLKLASPAEAGRARAELARAEAALSEPRQAINSQAQMLAVLMGQSEPDPQWFEPGAQPHLGSWQLTEAPADMLRTRPEIASAEAEVLRAAGELGISRADIYPHIGIGASIQWSANIARNHRAHTGEAIFSLGPVIDIPLFDWGQRVATAHAKDHELKASVLAYRQAVLQGVAETEIAMGDLEELRTREEAMQRARDALRQTSDAMGKRTELGLGSHLDLQDSLIDMHRADMELIGAVAARDLAYVSLYKALGGAPLPDTKGAN
ncbi:MULTISPECIES: TolC family protein [Dyella]|uniref:TolC family protein n=2 Tax=Dyella TaxID=231454 RepID=A0A4R0YT28_9GAMM|nr:MULTISPECIES: TolC family protein [Dyella]TBR40036.1 TolC family protein [Dyella terrae]TCI12382.1 TolC family protein [Dyella soli]